jgi:predicted porin
VQPFYRLQYIYYPHYSDNTIVGLTTDPRVGRNDLLNDVGITLVYQFTKNFTARAFVDYQVQNSDYKSTAPALSVDFHNLNAGAGLTLDFRF